MKRASGPEGQGARGVGRGRPWQAAATPPLAFTHTLHPPAVPKGLGTELQASRPRTPKEHSLTQLVS